MTTRNLEARSRRCRACASRATATSRRSDDPSPARETLRLARPGADGPRSPARVRAGERHRHPRCPGQRAGAAADSPAGRRGAARQARDGRRGHEPHLSRGLARPRALHPGDPPAYAPAQDDRARARRLADAPVHRRLQGRHLPHPPRPAGTPAARLHGGVRDPGQRQGGLAPGDGSRRGRPVRRQRDRQVPGGGALDPGHRDRAPVDALAARALHPVPESAGDLRDHRLRAPGQGAQAPRERRLRGLPGLPRRDPERHPADPRQQPGALLPAAHHRQGRRDPRLLHRLHLEERCRQPALVRRLSVRFRSLPRRQHADGAVLGPHHRPDAGGVRLPLVHDGAGAGGVGHPVRLPRGQRRAQPHQPAVDDPPGARLSPPEEPVRAQAHGLRGAQGRALRLRRRTTGARRGVLAHRARREGRLRRARAGAARPPWCRS